MKKVMTTMEITDSEARLLQAQERNGKHRITFCDIQPIGSQSDEDLVKLLKNMISTLPANPKEFILLIPRRTVLLKQMRIPSDHYDEIQDIIGLRLIHNIPYPVEDVGYPHYLIGRDSEGASLVLTMIIHREVSQRYYRLIHKAGIKNGKLVLSSLGILQWLAYQEKAHKVAHSQPLAVINIDTQWCEICFCHNGKLFFSRSVPYGKEYLEEGNIKELAHQMKLSMEAYHKESLGPAIQKILILSSTEAGQVLSDHLQSELNISARTYNPFEDHVGLPHLNGSVLKKENPSLLTAGLGCLLSDNKDLVDLASAENYAAKQMRDRKRRFLKFACLLWLMAGFSISGPLVEIHHKRSDLKALEGKIQQFKPQAKEARQKIQFVKYFDQKVSQNFFIPDLIAQLNRLTPEDIIFRNLSLNKEGILAIQGYAPSQADINDFQARLIQSSGFYDVDLKFATKRMIDNIPVMDFHISSRLENNKENAL